MNDDPYTVLGVARDASQADIKSAYRKLAKTLHPDLHPGDKTKEKEFLKVGSAYAILSDVEKRRQFDAGEIDARGQERPQQQYYRQHAEADPQGRYASSDGYGDFGDASDIFADLFSRRARGGGGAGGFDAPGSDLRYHLDVDFMDAALGAKRQIPLPGGGTIDLSIPAGIRQGQTLRLRGKGQAGFGKGPPGDAHVEISVGSHPFFVRDGNDIEVEVPITFDEAVLGAKVEVPTLAGRVSMTIPKGASTGRRLRLKGRGVKPAKGKPGDQTVVLKIVLPELIDAEMEEIARRWQEAAKEDPRAELWRTP